MQKALVLFLVATLLLAGCTELLDSEDGETMKIEINEDIAFEKINDFMTVDEGESFGITMMYEMDSNMLAESGLIDSDEASNAVITVEMTEAWSPAGYHTSQIMGMSNEGITYKMVETITHIDTTMYVTTGYDATGTLPSDATDEEKMQFEMISQQGIESYSMTTSNSHTDVIASMAEDTQNDGDDIDMMEMLEVFTFTECMGVFTPSTETVDGLQIFDVTMVDMEDSMTPDMALCLFDTDNSDSISFEEFTASDNTEEGDVDEMRTVFDNADANANGELDSTELVTFIESMDSLEDEEEQMQDEDQSGEMPDMSVAFNNAGEIEYFGMSMDGTEMQMYVLTEDKVSAFFTGAEAGELVALPFNVVRSSEMNVANEYFWCDNGEGIPISYVNDGYDDCDGGEDEDTTDGSDNGGDNGEDQSSEDDGLPSPQDLLDMTDTDQNGLMDFDEFITFMSEDDEAETGESMPQSVIDELQEMFNATDDDNSGDLDLDELEWFIMDVDEYMSSDDELLFQYECIPFVDDSVSITTADGFNMTHDDTNIDSAMCGEIVSETMQTRYWDTGEFTMPENLTYLNCDDDGQNCEAAYLAAVTSVDCDVCDTKFYDSFVSSYEECDEDDWDDNTGFCTQYIGTLINSDSMAFEFVKEQDSGLVYYQYDAGTNSGLLMVVAEVDDGMDDNHDGHDDDSGDDGMDDNGDDMGGSDEWAWYITNDIGYHFEGDMSDYKIELATCEYDYDMDTGEETRTCETVMEIDVQDAETDSNIMFHDADSSGTISVGDTIHISEVDQYGNIVRLYSISADAYSDENPMNNAPGFTGVVGMLALLGAAFIRRNE